MAAITSSPTDDRASADMGVPPWVRIAFQDSGLATCVAGPELTVLWANGAMHALIDPAANSRLSGRTLTEIAHRDEGVRIEEAATRALVRGATGAAQSPAVGEPESSSLQVQGVERDRWLQLVLVAVPLAEDSMGLLVHAIDISADVLTRRSLSVMSENALDLVLLMEPGGRVSWASPSVRTVLGHEPGAWIGRDLGSLAAYEDRMGLSDVLAAATPDSEPVVRTVRFRSTSGAYRYMSVSARPADRTDPAGTVGEIAVALRDITEELRAKRELARSEEQFRMAMLGAPEGMAVTDSQDRIVQVNPALCELLGANADSLIGHRFREFIPMEDREEVDRWRERLLRGSASIERCQHRLVSVTSNVWVDHSVGMMSDEVGNPQLFVHQFADRTAARRLQDDLAYRASHDVATGLANRESLRTRLNQRLGHPPESSERVGVLFCDIDNLKPVNDRLGHLTGDAVIAAVANRLERAVRRQDVVARVGGDEFVIVLDHCASIDELAVVARNVHSAASHPVKTSAGSIDISISVGAVLAPSTAGTDEALAQADAALYRAKRGGRNQICVETDADPIAT